MADVTMDLIRADANVENFIDSITEHAFRKHRPDLRNERSTGQGLSPSKSKGDALEIVEKENFRQHLRETLTDPNTKYFIDDSTGRMTFFNDAPNNRTMLIFNPAQFETDGHAGTIIRSKPRLGDVDFDNALEAARQNMGGKAPVVSSVSDGRWIGHLDHYSAELANTPRRVLAKGDLPEDYRAARDFKADLPYEPQRISVEIGQVVEEVAQKPGMLRAAFESAAPILKTTGIVVLGSLPIIGLLPNTVEAAELKGTLAEAIDRGEISRNALLEYDVIMGGHVAQGLDPTMIGGELGVQAAYNDWADRYNVQGELREKLQPSSLALMIKDGGEYLAETLPQASYDVAAYTAVQSVSGASALTGYGLDTIDTVYDDMTGNTALRSAVYDALPVLELPANDASYDPASNDFHPINMFPVAHDLAEIKTQIVGTQSMIDGINLGTRSPFNGMSPTESADFLQGRIDRLQDRFEGNFEEAQRDGTLHEVSDYVAQYGNYSALQGPPALMQQTTDPAASNENSWDAPKVQGMKL